MLSFKSLNSITRLLNFSSKPVFKTALISSSTYVQRNIYMPPSMEIKSMLNINQQFFSLYSSKTRGPCLPHRTKSRFNSPKRRRMRKASNYKLGNHRGLLKRIKIVGPRRDRRFKFLSANKRHCNRKRSRSNLIRKRRTRYIKKCDMDRVKRMLPNWRRQKFKAAH